MDNSKNVGVLYSGSSLTPRSGSGTSLTTIEPAGKLPKRKEIRLKSYDYKSDGFYFITICTDFKKPFLQNERAEAIVVAELARLSTRFKGVNVDYSVIMPNHIHLILYFKNSKYGLSRVIQAFKSLTTLKAKQALPLQITANLWQRNYYEHVIRDETALFKIREYVKNNPLAERIRFEEFYESGSDKSVPSEVEGSDPYKNCPPPP